MAAMTCQTILNKILTRLRNTNLVNAVPITDTYQLLLLEFFNQIKQEVEDACDWRSLYQTFTVTVASGTYYAVVPSSNERSRVVRVPILGGGMSQSGYKPSLMPADGLVALVFDTTSPSTSGRFPLHELPLNQLLYNFQATGDQQVATPEFFSLGVSNSDTGSGGDNEQVLYVYPAVNNARTVEVTLVVPQSEFTTGLQDVNGVSNLLCPSQPVVAGLEWMAREEFGEELGEGGAFTEERYREILDNAVSREEAALGNSVDLILL